MDPPIASRNLLHTGVTRGERLVALVGRREALAMDVRNAAGCRRAAGLGSPATPSS